MGDVLDVCVESSRGASRKVTPLFDDQVSLTEFRRDEHVLQVKISMEEVEAVGDDGDVFSGGGEANPQDGWLPITESRKGSTWTATFHLLSSGIGIQVLFLPVAFASLGWLWGTFWLCLLFSWQLYTIWLLVDLHESSPSTGLIRYSRFLHLSIVAFGEKLGKILAIFPTMYLSGGACVLLIITGGTTLQLFYDIMCSNNSNCKATTLTGPEWYLVFICSAILIAQFFPNLNSLALISFVGSVAGVAYSTLLWALPVAKGTIGETELSEVDGHIATFRDVVNGIGILALAFRGHNLVLEIQGTIPRNRKQASRKAMWRGVTMSYLVIAMCMFPVAIAGYRAYGNKIPRTGILTAFTEFHNNNVDTSKYVIGAIYLIILINCQCAFQIYAMPTFDNFERIYTTKNNKPCPRWVRSVIKVMFGGLAYFIAVAFPFLPRLGAFIGAFALPVTFSYPCLMWVEIKKPHCFSRMWCLNKGIGYLAILLCILLAGVALWSLIVDGLDANFFNP